MLCDFRGQRLVIGVERRKLRSERNARRAGERAHVDQKLGRFFVGKRQRIGQDQAAFGVGIADFDRDAFARFVDVERPHGGAGHRVLDRGNENAQSDLEPGVHHHLRQRQHIGGAAHVLFH